MAEPIPAAPDLERAVLDHRIRSETSREVVREGERRRVASLEVRLFATLARGAGTLPGEPAFQAAMRALVRLAEAALARADGGADGEIEPQRHALYDSRHFPGRDEVCVLVRLPLRFAEDGRQGEGQEARLAELRRRLEALGVHEGRWRPRPAPAGEEAWAVRPAAEAFAGR